MFGHKYHTILQFSDGLGLFYKIMIEKLGLNENYKLIFYLILFIFIFLYLLKVHFKLGT